MAAVTVTKYRTSVIGSDRESFYTLNVATSGDTLTTPFHIIKAANANDVAITKLGVSGGTVTFTTTGAVTGALVSLVGE
jgi:hypothetical protein